MVRFSFFLFGSWADEGSALMLKVVSCKRVQKEAAETDESERTKPSFSGARDYDPVTQF